MRNRRTPSLSDLNDFATEIPASPRQTSNGRSCSQDTINTIVTMAHEIRARDKKEKRAKKRAKKPKKKRKRKYPDLESIFSEAAEALEREEKSKVIIEVNIL